MCHTCPYCGMECDCNGDIDDIDVMSPEWVAKNCEHDCDEDDYEYDPDDEDYPDDMWPDDYLG